MKNLLLFVSVIASTSVNAQWSGDSKINIFLTDTAVTTNSGSSFTPRAINIGSDEVLITWAISTINGNILSANGNKQWEQYNTIGSSRSPGFIAGLTNQKLVSDGHDGAFMTWMEQQKHVIGGSHINLKDTITWDEIICNSSGSAANPAIAPDGNGGAIIVWEDTRDGSGNSNIYAQRVSLSGELLWAANGVPVCKAAGDQILPDIATDSLGGAFITWQDSRTTTKKIFAQRLMANGDVAWQADGIVICALNDAALAPKIVSTSKGEAIITWTNPAAGGTWDIFAQKVNEEKVAWQDNGVPVCNAPLSQTEPAIIADGSGGAIISWTDTRVSFSNPDIYAQSINSGGNPNWTVNGVPVCTAVDRQAAPALTTDGDHGAIIAWEDQRSGYYDIYAQRVNNQGTIMWSNNGEAVSTAEKDQRSVTIASDGKGGAVLAWQDFRNSVKWNIFTEGINNDGKLKKSNPTSNKPELSNGFILEQNYPNPWNTSTTIRYKLPTTLFTRLTVYNALGQQITQLVNEKQTVGDHEVVFDRNNLPLGAYFYQLQAGNISIKRKMILIQ